MTTSSFPSVKNVTDEATTQIVFMKTAIPLEKVSEIPYQKINFGKIYISKKENSNLSLTGALLLPSRLKLGHQTA